MIFSMYRLGWITLCALILALALSVGNLIGMRDRIGSINDGVSTGPMWFVTSIETEYQELLLSLAQYDHESVTGSQISQQFDVLWRRLIGTREGEVSATLAAYQIETSAYERVLAEMGQYKDQFVNFDEMSREDRDTIFRMLVAHQSALHNISLQVLYASSNETLLWRDGLLRNSRQDFFFSSATMALILGLLLLFVSDRRKRQLELREKVKLLAEARAADRAKSEFISVMNHELRTPLTSINGAVALLEAGAVGAVPEKFQKVLDIAKRNGAHLSTLINDLLDVEKFASGKMTYTFDNFELSAFLIAQAEVNSTYGQIYDVPVIVDPDMSQINVQGDTQRLAQVMSNLISNAAKFSNPGEPVVLSATQKNDRVVITVTDTGCGIPQEAHARIFDRFQQVDSSTTRARGGTGLGLSIARSIVEAHGGTLSFESVVGEGTTFHFDLALGGET